MKTKTMQNVRERLAFAVCIQSLTNSRERILRVVGVVEVLDTVYPFSDGVLERTHYTQRSGEN